MKSSSEIRQEFLQFFADKKHTIVPSAPVFPQDDPTLLFTNAGMNQFKDVFLGRGKRDYTRATDTQKCIRVSGKHNDLEEVGWDTYHHTFFEMLGNWSFGDYFKKEAISWAWELLVHVWGLPADKLYATFFKGSPKEKLPADQESAELWASETDLPSERILGFGKKDNFWEMGALGPCGPCTEIHLDRGEKACDKQGEKGHICAVNGGCARYIEIWNLVFIQLNRLEGGTLQALPARHVDTGMGFERITAVLQGVISNYDTDLFTPIFEAISELVDKKYGEDLQIDVAFRVIADHARALCVAFADGALPGNSGRGYVLRRLLRRASRYGRQKLEMEEPFIYKLVDPVAEIFRDVFPEIFQRRDHLKLLIQSEEEAFGRTLDKGIALFCDLVKGLGKKKKLPGQKAYDLYSTYGFPKDLIELMAREEGLSLDGDGWEKAREDHRKKSEGQGHGEVDLSELEGLSATEFTGYNRGNSAFRKGAKIVKFIGTSRLVLDRTPFYAESGGQMADGGIIEGKDFLFEVEDTQKYGHLIVHIGELKQGDLTKLPKKVVAQVDQERKKSIMANHTATHLLHWALKQLFGESANQAGSLVAPQRLRFDVTIPRKITSEEIRKMEEMINEKICQNTPLRTEIQDLEEAKKRGAMALFGEKYDQQVRVVSMGDYSLELCGGTHCRSTGEIGSFMITSESALQTGVRRIEAITRLEATRQMQKNRTQLQKLSQALSIPAHEVVHRVEKLTMEIKELKKKSQQSAQQELGGQAKELLKKATKKGDVHLITVEIPGGGPKDLQVLADHLVSSNTSLAGILASSQNGKVHLITLVSKDLITKELNAPLLIREVAPVVGGRGGGRPDRGQGGGTMPEKIPQALEKARKWLLERV